MMNGLGRSRAYPDCKGVNANVANLPDETDSKSVYDIQ